MVQTTHPFEEHLLDDTQTVSYLDLVVALDEIDVFHLQVLVPRCVLEPLVGQEVRKGLDSPQVGESSFRKQDGELVDAEDAEDCLADTCRHWLGLSRSANLHRP